MPGETYFQWALQYLKQFLADSKGYVAFIPYAAVGFSYAEYEQKLAQAWAGLNLQVKSVHHAPDKRSLIENASAIAVGGGNSFALLNKLYEEDLMGVIRSNVAAGKPYIGWSAGSNMACPTLKTTNDMPIVQPPSFEALNLIHFQINPHYTEQRIPNHGGESRVERIKEFLAINQSVKVLGLPEGMLLRKTGNKLMLEGNGEAVVFNYGADPTKIKSSTDLSKLLH